MKEDIGHLKYFKVENFKMFDSFEMDDIGQFNLILGDNNVGKTSVLEALLVESNALETLGNLLASLHYRIVFTVPIYKVDYLNFYIKDKSKEGIFYYFKDTPSPSIVVSRLQIDSLSDAELTKVKNTSLGQLSNSDIIAKYKHKNKTDFFISDISKNKNKPSGYIAFVPSYFADLNHLEKYYSQKFQSDRQLKNALIENLKIFIPNIENIEVSTSILPGQQTLIFWLKGEDNPLPLFTFGDGAKQLLRILVEFPMAANKRLMIDEIDNGIHFSHFKKYWTTIIKSAIHHNVQIFATTHNIECLKYFKEALEDPELQQYQERARAFTLAKSPEGQVKAFKSNFEQFEHAIEQGIEIR